jgi:hypothetical protein
MENSRRDNLQGHLDCLTLAVRDVDGPVTSRAVLDGVYVTFAVEEEGASPADEPVADGIPSRGYIGPWRLKSRRCL